MQYKEFVLRGIRIGQLRVEYIDASFRDLLNAAGGRLNLTPILSSAEIESSSQCEPVANTVTEMFPCRRRPHKRLK
jgi:fibrillarin-like rRNA methylase